MITGINHITLAVAELDRAVDFYRQVLGFTLAHRWERGAYLEAGSVWLCLALEDSAIEHGNDYTHTAFDVNPEDFDALCERIKTAGASIWKTNRSEGNSLYFNCPDGHRLEIHVGSLHSRLRKITEDTST